MMESKNNESIILKSNIRSDGFIESNVDKIQKLRAYFVFYPDIFLDLIKSPVGGINLSIDQRVFLRCCTRFQSMHGTASRGYGKTFIEVLAAYITAVLFPNMKIAITCQTVENAASILEQKHREILTYYPMLGGEVFKVSFSRNRAFIEFRNGARIDVLSNSQNSKGQRRHRIEAEESALIDSFTWIDALKPVTEVGRTTCGAAGINNPYEHHQKSDFFTTPTMKGSDDHARVVTMIQNMADLKGSYVFGCSWFVPAFYSRGSTKSKMIEAVKDMSLMNYLNNYACRWCGSGSDSLVSVNRLLKCRTLTEPVLEKGKKDEFAYYIGVDVARSMNTSNNQSSLVVGRTKYSQSGKLQFIEVVRVFNIPNTTNFTQQAIIIKRMQKLYNAKIVVLDSNGLGIGLQDELLKNTIDPMNGDILPCFGTVNTNDESEDYQSEIKCLYSMKAQTCQTKVISDFIQSVDTGTLRLLVHKDYNVFDAEKNDEYDDYYLSFIQTDLMVEEINNLRLIQNGKNLSIGKSISKIDKDRASALQYMIYYIIENESTNIENDYADFEEMFKFRAPQIRT